MAWGPCDSSGSQDGAGGPGAESTALLTEGRWTTRTAERRKGGPQEGASEGGRDVRDDGT